MPRPPTFYPTAAASAGEVAPPKGACTIGRSMASSSVNKLPTHVSFHLETPGPLPSYSRTIKLRK